ncbi:hypothetical protein [Poriferisphaera sp. WC338]|uniref:hypothetical protein n=1 Tax=Poriferisphaera sp. WC338 TaxID=3425129 RepID=UPI003D81C421
MIHDDVTDVMNGWELNMRNQEDGWAKADRWFIAAIAVNIIWVLAVVALLVWRSLPNSLMQWVRNSSPELDDAEVFALIINWAGAIVLVMIAISGLCLWRGMRLANHDNKKRKRAAANKDRAQ